MRDFSVNDVTMYPIALSWSSSGAGGGGDSMEVEGAEAADGQAAEGGAEAAAAAEKKAGGSGSNTVVFTKFNPVPNTKMLTFYRKESFTLTASYDDAAELPNGFPRKINEFVISNIPLPPPGEDGKQEPAKIKVKLRLDLHGCLVLESAVAIEEEIVDEEPPPAPIKVDVPAAAAPAPDAPPADGAAPAEGADAAMPAADGADGAEAAAAPAAAEAAPKEEAKAEAEPPKKKKKIKRIALKVDGAPVGMSDKEMMDAQELEGNMSHADKLVQVMIPPLPCPLSDVTPPSSARPDPSAG